jgi:hypothetical protein
MRNYIDNGAGATRPIKASGLGHRRGSVHQRAELAVDALTGARPYQPTRGELQRALHVPGPVLRKHLKQRHQQGNGNPGNGFANGNGNGNGDAVHSASPAPAADRYIVDRQLNDLIFALDEVIHVLVNLRDRQST